MRALLFTSSVLLLLLTGCPSDTVAPEGRLCVEVVGDELVITNRTGQTLHFMVVGTRAVPLINWVATCNDGNALPPNQPVRVKLADIYGYRPDDTVSLFWWNCANRQASELVVRAEYVQSLRVTANPSAGVQCETVR